MATKIDLKTPGGPISLLMESIQLPQWQFRPPRRLLKTLSAVKTYVTTIQTLKWSKEIPKETPKLPIEPCEELIEGCNKTQDCLNDLEPLEPTKL